MLVTGKGQLIRCPVEGIRIAARSSKTCLGTASICLRASNRASI